MIGKQIEALIVELLNWSKLQTEASSKKQGLTKEISFEMRLVESKKKIHNHFFHKLQQIDKKMELTSVESNFKCSVKATLQTRA